MNNIYGSNLAAYRTDFTTPDHAPLACPSCHTPLTDQSTIPTTTTTLVACTACNWVGDITALELSTDTSPRAIRRQISDCRREDSSRGDKGGGGDATGKRKDTSPNTQRLRARNRAEQANAPLRPDTAHKVKRLARKTAILRLGLTGSTYTRLRQLAHALHGKANGRIAATVLDALSHVRTQHNSIPTRTTSPLDDLAGGRDRRIKVPMLDDEYQWLKIVAESCKMTVVGYVLACLDVLIAESQDYHPTDHAQHIDQPHHKDATDDENAEAEFYCEHCQGLFTEDQLDDWGHCAACVRRVFSGELNAPGLLPPKGPHQ